MSQSNSTLSPFVYYCSEILLPPEYFLTSIIITVTAFISVITLLIFVAVKAKQAKKDLAATKRTWITALDFIGGIGGVDSVFESYETFLGKNRDELEKIRRDNIENRRYSEPGLVTESSDAETGTRKVRAQEQSQRSRSNIERIRRVRTDSDEEAEFYLRVLQYPDLLLEHNKAVVEEKARQERSGSLVSILKRRLSSSESLSVGENSPNSPSQVSSLGSVTPSPRVIRGSVTPSPGVSRIMRSSSLDVSDEGVTRRSPLYVKKKKPSVIQELNEV